MDETYFSFVDSEKIIKIAPETPSGEYKIQVTLTDDNLENPQRSTVTFNVFVVEDKEPDFVTEFIHLNENY